MSAQHIQNPGVLPDSGSMGVLKGGPQHLPGPMSSGRPQHGHLSPLLPCPRWDEAVAAVPFRVCAGEDALTTAGAHVSVLDTELLFLVLCMACGSRVAPGHW